MLLLVRHLSLEAMHLFLVANLVPAHPRTLWHTLSTLSTNFRPFPTPPAMNPPPQTVWAIQTGSRTYSDSGAAWGGGPTGTRRCFRLRQSGSARGVRCGSAGSKQQPSARRFLHSAFFSICFLFFGRGCCEAGIEVSPARTARTQRKKDKTIWKPCIRAL